MSSNSLNFSPLFNEILNKYILQCSRIQEPNPDRPGRIRVVSNVVLTPLEGGEPIRATMTNPGTMERQVCRAVARALPNSQFANKYRSLSFSRRVVKALTLEQELELGTQLHVGLRKLCDSSASSLWWNLLSHMSELGVFFVFAEAARRAYDKAFTDAEGNEKKVCRMYDLIPLTRTELETAFSACYSRFSSLERGGLAARKELITYWGFTRQFIDGLTINKEEEIVRCFKHASMAVNYLSNEDIEAMWGFLID